MQKRDDGMKEKKKSGRVRRVVIGSCLLVLGFASCEKRQEGEFSGYILGEYVEVSAPDGGQLVRVEVEKGMRVEEGQELFGLDSHLAKYKLDEYAGLLAQAESNLENARKGWRGEEVLVVDHVKKAAQAMYIFAEQELARAKELFRTQVVAEQNLNLNQALDHALREVVAALDAFLQTGALGGRPDELAAMEAGVRSLRAQVDEARWRLGEKVQKAPVGGLVRDVYYRKGERVGEGNPVVSLLPDGGVKVRFFVSQRSVPDLRMRQGVEVEYGEKRVEGKISFISQEAEYAPPVIFSREHSAKLVFLVEADFLPEEARRLHPGQPVEVRILGK